MEEIVGRFLSSDSVFALFAGVFLWLYVTEKKAHISTQRERISDLKLSMDSVHKSVGLLDVAIAELRLLRGGKQG